MFICRWRTRARRGDAGKMFSLFRETTSRRMQSLQQKDLSRLQRSPPWRYATWNRSHMLERTYLIMFISCGDTFTTNKGEYTIAYLMRNRDVCGCVSFFTFVFFRYIFSAFGTANAIENPVLKMLSETVKSHLDYWFLYGCIFFYFSLFSLQYSSHSYVLFLMFFFFTVGVRSLQIKQVCVCFSLFNIEFSRRWPTTESWRNVFSFLLHSI